MFNFNFDFNFGPQVVEKKEIKTYEDFREAAGLFKLYESQKDFVKAFTCQDTKVKLILGSRDIGKTDILTLGHTAYDIYKDPENFDCMLVTKVQSRGRDLVDEISTYLDRVGIKPKIKNANTIRTYEKLGKENNLFYCSSGSKAFRSHHVKRIIFDDIVTPEDTSPKERKRVQKVFTESLNLTNDLIVLGQPAHRLDLYSNLRKQKGISEFLFPNGYVPERTKDLQALRDSGVKEEDIEMNYLLRIPEYDSLLFKHLTLGELTPPKGCVAFIDEATTGSDYTAITIGWLSFDRYCILGFAWRKAWYDCVEDFKRLTEKYKISKVIFETNRQGEEPLRVLRQEGIPAIGWHTTVNKYNKIAALAAHQDYITIAADSNLEYKNQFINYEDSAEHDDAPDSAASLAMYYNIIKIK